ncbi:hypothetical protein MVEN_02529100 [Mycena venus]|uniref:Histone H4 n=1 Tax=Mycena venus TaxID=2733690 RepID=A0A8H7C9J3_9AGAR|nr:hypothetical protein MVEN_02529100 [Mycena venus]
MLDQLPPEIFGHVLEIGTEAWGIGFLPTICLVSSICNDVVVSTPSLWGIFVVDRQSSVPLLNRQLVKAKETDLRITFSRKQSLQNKHARKFVANLVSLAHNWVRVDMSTNLLTGARWADMRRVEVLRLRFNGTQGSADEFFVSPESPAYGPPNLHSFTATGLTEKWVTPFLSPRITYLELGRLGGRWEKIPASTIHKYLSLTPNVHTLCLPELSFLPFSASKDTVSLRSLHNLELTRVHDFTPLLLNLHAPALRALIIRDCTGQINSIFSHWSQPSVLPANLQFLELANCISPKDIPFLIGFLARLPALLRLMISDTEDIVDPSPSPSAETDLFEALASPDGAGAVIGGWLCPSLIHLCLDIPLRVADILTIVRARGGDAARIAGSPARLCSLQGPLCSSGYPEEVAELRSYFADPEDVRCLCLSCSFNLSTTGESLNLFRLSSIPANIYITASIGSPSRVDIKSVLFDTTAFSRTTTTNTCLAHQAASRLSCFKPPSHKHPSHTMSGRGKGGKGLGKGGAKRHRKILRDNIQGITKPAIRRLARRGGVKRISGLIYEETRGVLKIFLENVIRDSVTYTEHAKRKTVTALDVVYALKRSGRTLYGFGA